MENGGSRCGSAKHRTDAPPERRVRADECSAPPCQQLALDSAATLIPKLGPAAVEVTLLRSVWIGPNAPKASSGYSIDRANLKVSCATQDVHTHALCVSHHLEINGVPTNAKILNPDSLD